MAEERGGSFYGAVTVSERGQIVIPAQARRDLGIQIGEKLLIVGGPGGGLLLIRASAVNHMLRQWAALARQLRDAEMVEESDEDEKAQ